MNHSFNVTVAELYGLQEAVLLENIYFWCKKNEANNKLTEGRPWTYNTVKAFNTQFKYLSPAVITRALKNLEKADLIDVGEFNNNAYDHTKWYCITDKCRAYFEESSKPKEGPETPSENSESNYDFSKSKNESKNSIAKKEQILMTDINSDNKPNINSDTPSPQPNESSDNASLPQEENSKSHYEPFSPSEGTSSDSESLPKRKRNSKSHCGSATEEKETSEFKQVKDLYLKNYNTLVEQKIITAQKFSQKQWQSFGATINQNIAKYGLESVLKILTNSFDDDFCRRSGYILTTIFHTNIAPRLLVAPNYYPNSFNKQSSIPRSYQQPRQFDENHLFF